MRPDNGPAEGSALPSFRLDGRLVVVTGASEGIGRAIALSYAAAGASVVLASRREEVLAGVQREIAAGDGTASVVQVDVRSVESIRALAAFVECELDGDRSQLVLVNNAGNAFTKPALEATEEDWDSVFDTHVKGAFFCSQALAPLMLRQGYGKIINLSSTWSRSTDPAKSVYCAAKAAVSHLTAALSTEWAPQGIRVNALAPTAVLTTPTRQAVLQDQERSARLLSRIPLGRYATTDDLLGAAIFLASEASDFVTGQTMFVDGGWNGAQ